MTYIPPIKVKSNEKGIREIIAATFPSYKRHHVYLVPTTSITLSDLNWSGGTRTEYRACTIDCRPIMATVDMNSPAPWDNKFEGKTVELPINTVIVQGGYFCGKVAMLRINVNPENMAKLLPGKEEER